LRVKLAMISSLLTISYKEDYIDFLRKSQLFLLTSSLTFSQLKPDG